MKSNISIDINAIEELFKSFYDLTNIKIALFDDNYCEVVSYPNSHCHFCSLIRTNLLINQKCDDSNTKSFVKSKESKKLHIYRCHAGLIEATAPVIGSDGIIKGYLMFGQIIDEKDKNIVKNKLEAFLVNNGFSNYSDNELKITRKSLDQIKSASKILEACTMYLILKDTIKYQKESFIEKLNDYIDNHLKDNLSIYILLKEFNMTRNAFYNASKEFLNIGVAEYIKLRRIEKAKFLLVRSNGNIKRISENVGFDDYNYFCRCFKKVVGIPAKKYRNSFSKIKSE